MCSGLIRVCIIIVFLVIGTGAQASANTCQFVFTDSSKKKLFAEVQRLYHKMDELSSSGSGLTDVLPLVRTKSFKHMFDSFFSLLQLYLRNQKVLFEVFVLDGTDKVPYERPTIKILPVKGHSYLNNLAYRMNGIHEGSQIVFSPLHNLVKGFLGSYSPKTQTVYLSFNNILLHWRADATLIHELSHFSMDLNVFAPITPLNSQVTFHKLQEIAYNDYFSFDEIRAFLVHMLYELFYRDKSFRESKFNHVEATRLFKMQKKPIKTILEILEVGARVLHESQVLLLSDRARSVDYFGRGAEQTVLFNWENGDSLEMQSKNLRVNTSEFYLVYEYSSSLLARVKSHNKARKFTLNRRPALLRLQKDIAGDMSGFIEQIHFLQPLLKELETLANSKEVDESLWQQYKQTLRSAVRMAQSLRVIE